MEYLEARAKIHNKRLQGIITYTQSRKNYLIQSQSTSSRFFDPTNQLKSSERNLPVDHSTILQSNQKGSMEALIDQSIEKFNEIEPSSDHHDNAEPAEYHVKDIPTKKWKQNEWQVENDPFSPFENFGVDYHSLRRSYTSKGLNPRHSTDGRFSNGSNPSQSINLGELSPTKTVSKVTNEESSSKSPVRYVQVRLSSLDNRVKQRFIVSKYRTPIPGRATFTGDLSDFKDVSPSHSREYMSPAKRRLKGLQWLSKIKQSHSSSKREGANEDSKYDFSQFSKFNEEELLQSSQRQSGLVHGSLSYLEDSDSATKAAMIKKALEAETRQAIRNKLNLNNTLSLISIGKPAGLKGAQTTLYNQTITAVDTAPEQRPAIEKKPSPIKIRLQRKFDSVTDFPIRMPSTVKTLTKQTSHEKRQQSFERPAETVNILDHSQFTASRHESPRHPHPRYSSEAEVRKARHRNLTESPSKSHLPALSMRTEELEYSNPNTLRVFIKRDAKLERRGFHPGHVFSLDEKSFRPMKRLTQ